VIGSGTDVNATVDNLLDPQYVQSVINKSVAQK
jgi:hypothetical protein